MKLFPYRPTMMFLTGFVPACALLGATTGNPWCLLALVAGVVVGTVVAGKETLRRFAAQRTAKDATALKCEQCGTVLLKPAPFVMMSRCTGCGTLYDIVPRTR